MDEAQLRYPVLELEKKFLALPVPLLITIVSLFGAHEQTQISE
jgi:hypothetical protein